MSAGMQQNYSGGSDQRYIPRWISANRATYQFEDDPAIHEGRTKDLNCAGACITSDHHFEKNQKVKLTIYLNDRTPVKVDGRIVWTKFSNKDTEIGIDFSNTSDEAQELILKHAFEIDKNNLIKHWYKGWDGS